MQNPEASRCLDEFSSLRHYSCHLPPSPKTSEPDDNEQKLKSGNSGTAPNDVNQPSLQLRPILVYAVGLVGSMPVSLAPLMRKIRDM